MLAPARQTAPVVFASPHSGRDYPPEFVASSRLDVIELRRSEDAYMDEIFAAAPDHGAPLLCAQFPRAYVDANREAFELDPAMFADPLPDYVNTSSPRIAAGLGTIARVVNDGEDIYRGPLRFKDAEHRIHSLYRPYHNALEELVQATKNRFGGCLLVDCHSMPSTAGSVNGGKAADVVLGDCFGTACAAAITNTAQHALEGLGFAVMRNKPYAGGFTTRHYGRPKNGIHVLQVEINRALYMDEKSVRRGDGLPELKSRIGGLIRALVGIDPQILQTA
jgi:N-formylglutamate amidohydrolase